MGSGVRACLGRALIGLVLCVACVTRTQQFAIEVKRGSAVDEKLHIAKSVVTEERFTRLKDELKQRWSGLTDAQLARMGLRWNVTHFRSFNGETSTSVTVIVAMQEQPGVDAAAIVKTAATLLDVEINGAAAVGVEQPR